MPQKIDSKDRTWIEELGMDWQQTHQKYLHTIGNLTLTGYYSELGNISFQEKQETKGGFRSSPLWLNGSLAKLGHWVKMRLKKEQLH